MTPVRLCALVGTVLLIACGDDAVTPELEDFQAADGGAHEDSGHAPKDLEDGAAADAGTAAQGDAGELGGDADDHPVGDAGAAADGSSSAPRMKDVYDAVFKPAQCTLCHPGVHDGVDLSTVEKAYESLVGNTAVVCEGKPLVTPGNLEKSFLWDLVSKASPGCGFARMPDGLADLATAQDDVLVKWIRGGAQR